MTLSIIQRTVERCHFADVAAEERPTGIVERTQAERRIRVGDVGLVTRDRFHDQLTVDVKAQVVAILDECYQGGGRWHCIVNARILTTALPSLGVAAGVLAESEPFEQFGAAKMERGLAVAAAELHDHKQRL